MNLREAIYEYLAPERSKDLPRSVEDGVHTYVKIGNDKLAANTHFADLYKDKKPKFIAEKKNKYWAIYNYGWGRVESIHAFIDKETGDLYKPAGFKAPAKGARGNVTDAAFMEQLKARFDIFGGHLYMR